MTKVAVYRELADTEGMPYRAIAGGTQATGRTAGEALDALTSQLGERETDTLVIVRSMVPDQFFTDAQRRRLEELVNLRREAFAQKTTLSADCQRELERLVEAEVEATTARAAALLRELGR